MGIKRILTILAGSILLTAACATKHLPIQGIWHLASPSGDSEFIEVTRVSKNQFYIKGKGLPVNGLYNLKNNFLIMEAPEDARLTEYTWELESNKFTLIKEPPTRLTDKRLLGSTLIKQEKL